MIDRKCIDLCECKRRVKRAYVENVILCSHGQVDRKALIEPERYLLFDDKKESGTNSKLLSYGEMSEREIANALQLLERKTIAKT